MQYIDRIGVLSILCEKKAPQKSLAGQEGQEQQDVEHQVAKFTSEQFKYNTN